MLPNGVLLAPMAGVTDLPFRELCLELGAGMAVAEMLSADLSLKDSRKSRLRRQQGQREQLRSVQIVGSEPAQMAEAARFNADAGADIIDINMGCPAKKVCRKAAGSALLADEHRVGEILTAVVAAVDLPVTLKIRTGVSAEHRNGVQIARIAEASGIQALTVHGRTRADRFKGLAEYDTIRRIVETVSIPVIANGDITCAARARAVLAHTGAAGIMVGRGAQGQPWLPGMIARELALGIPENPPSVRAQFSLIAGHLTELHRFYGDMMGVRIARKHIGWFIDGLAASAIRSDCVSSFGSSCESSAPILWARRQKSLFNGIDTVRGQHEFLAALGAVMASNDPDVIGQALAA